MPPTLILVRHGHTQLNGPANERIRGHLNVPLDARGHEQARQIAKVVAHYPLTHIISSDLDRATDTALAIRRASKRKPPVKMTKKLRPWNLGDYEGQPVSKVSGAIGSLVAKRHTPPPGDGETFAEFSKRFLTFFSGILDHVRKHPDVLPILVAHTRNLRLAEAWLVHGNKGLTPSTIAGKTTTAAPGDGILITWNGREWKQEKLAGQHTPPSTKAS